MAKSNLQLTLEYTTTRPLLSAIGVLPRSLAIAFGRWLGYVFYLLPTKLKRTGRRNLDIAFPELPPAEKRRLLRGCFESLGRLLAEFSQFPRLTPARLRQMID